MEPVSWTLTQKGENFFNLSGHPIENEVLEQLKLGKKFTSFCKLNVKKELIANLIMNYV